MCLLGKVMMRFVEDHICLMISNLLTSDQGKTYGPSMKHMIAALRGSNLADNVADGEYLGAVTPTGSSFLKIFATDSVMDGVVVPLIKQDPKVAGEVLREKVSGICDMEREVQTKSCSAHSVGQVPIPSIR
jgi:hypothetical protein